MCVIEGPVISNSGVTVYKVALKDKKTRRYYSPAMGCEYPSDGEVPVVSSQSLLCPAAFNDQILENKAYGFRSEMVGRTSGFLSKSGSRDLFDEIRYYDLTGEDSFPPKYRLVILEVLLTGDLVYGNYRGFFIYAGKHMKILREVPLKEVRSEKGTSLAEYPDPWYAPSGWTRPAPSQIDSIQ